MVGAFAHGGVDLARTADGDEMGEAEFYQLAQALDTMVRRADDAEAMEEIGWDDVGLGGILEPVVVVVVPARNFLDDGGIRGSKR